MVRIQKRSKVLKYSLHLEHIASGIAAYLLDIEDTKTSYSFGNKSSALSFNQKINLLLDNKSISKDEKFILEAFSSIRNQFVHNIDADNYYDAINAINGLENKMRKLYPQNFKGIIEDDLQRCIEHLYNDGIKILTSFKGGVQNKMDISHDAKIYKEYFTKIESSIKKNLEGLEEALNAHDADMISKRNLLDILKLMKIEILSSPVIELKIFDKT